MVIGIDLGTTNCCLAVVDPDGRPVIIENSQGQRTTPSVVAYHPQQRLIGEVAKRQLVADPQHTVVSSKRLLGRNIEEVADIDYPLPLQGDQRGAVEIVLPEQRVKPVQVAAALLTELKQQAEQRLGTQIDQAVITVPAYFTDPQRLATKQAGEIAGLQVLRIINEPTAAALAYGLDDQQTERRVLVFDLGGGTLDVSVLEIGEGLFEVKGTGGDNHLGGDDFDQHLARWLAKKFQVQHGIDLSADPGSWQRLMEAAEQAKQDLSQTLQTEINLPFISADASGQPLHLQITISRAQLEEIVGDLLQRLAEPINDALSGGQVDQVLLVGGMSRMPAIIEQVRKLTAVEPRLADNPEQIVAQGAALQGALLSGQKGADIALIDVTPLSLGVETRGGVSTVMLAGDTPIPAQRQETFSTAEDGQESVQVHIVQGQQHLAKMNKSLGRFVLSGIPPAPAGIPEIVVTFAIDANGILEVSATERRSGQQQSIEIQGSSDLSAEEINILSDQERFLVDTQRQELNTLVAEAQKQLAASEQAPGPAGPEQPSAKLTDSQQQLRKILNNPEIIGLSAALKQLQDAVDHIDQHLD